MKTKLLLVTITVLSMFCLPTIQAVTIRSSGFEFSPDEVTINLGDTVRFDIGTFHNAVEVSEETWLADDTASNGGFRLPFGGGKVGFSEVGTYYFVCQPHTSQGMKGIIHVELPSSIAETEAGEGLQLFVYPNPATDMLKLAFNVENTGKVRIDLIDMLGQTISTLIDSEYSTGKWAESISVGNIEKGQYIILIRSNSGIRTQSLVKL